MAFIAFNEIGGAAVARYSVPTAAPLPTHDHAVTAARLEPLEWLVVAIARQDKLSSLRRPGRLAVALRSLFNQPNPMLADERLEALRRIAVLSWHHGYTVAPHEVRRFVAAGFTPEQYELVVDSIGVARASGSDTTFGVAAALADAAA